MPPKTATPKKGPKTTKATKATKSKPLAKVAGNAVKKPSAKKKDTQPTSKTTTTRTSLPQTSRRKSQTTSKSTSKASEKEKEKDPNAVNYLLYCRLRHTHDPTITRLISVPSTLKFDRLHLVMTTVFGWAGFHMYTFRVHELEELNPKSKMMGWPKTLLRLMSHMDIFPSNDDGDPPTENADEYSLSDIFENPKYKGQTQLIYEYDMGDGWQHDIVMLGHETPGVRTIMQIPDRFPIVCLGGEGHPCAEDSGGPAGFANLKHIFKPRTKDPRGLRKWYKTECANGDPEGLDPHDWSIFHVNEELGHLVKTPRFL